MTRARKPAPKRAVYPEKSLFRQFRIEILHFTGLMCLLGALTIAGLNYVEDHSAVPAYCWFLSVTGLIFIIASDVLDP